MGARKFRVGRIRKNEERKQQAKRKHKVGRPPKQHLTPPTQTTTSIEGLRSSCSLPPHWVDQSQGTTATFCKITQDPQGQGPQVSRSIVLGGEWYAIYPFTVYGVHEQRVLPSQIGVYCILCSMYSPYNCTICPRKLYCTAQHMTHTHCISLYSHWWIVSQVLSVHL